MARKKRRKKSRVNRWDFILGGLIIFIISMMFLAKNSIVIYDILNVFLWIVGGGFLALIIAPLLKKAKR